MERLKRVEMYKPKSKGGKGFPDIRKFYVLNIFRTFLINYQIKEDD